jgi:type 1 fimbriae regulatory protein FimB/type 1 fimbriae regulatory protein FimE
MILIAYRHGLRASEVCGLRWDQIDLNSGRLHVRRAKGGIDNVHPLSGREIRALRQLRRENMESRYVFVTERGGPATTAGFLKTVARTGEAAKLPFPIHPHMLRHSTGYKLANDGHDTRAPQHYMGHKNIMHTVRYTRWRLIGSRISGRIDTGPTGRSPEAGACSKISYSITSSAASRRTSS